MKFALKSTKSSSPNKTRAKSPKKKDEKFSTFTLKSTPSYRFEDGLLIEDDDIDPFNKQPSTSMNKTSSSHHESSDDNQDNKNGDVKKNDTIVMQPNPVQLVPKTVRECVMVVNGKDGCKLNDKGECLQPGNLSTCKHSLYNHPLPKEQLMDIFGFQQQNGKEVDDGSNHDSNKNLLLTEGGLIWKASILPNGYDTNYESKKTLKMLPLKFYDDKNKCIKPRRPTLAVVEKDFFDSLVKIEGINYTGSSVSGNRDSSTTTTKQEEFNFLGSIARQITVLKDEEHNIVWDQHKHHSKWIFSGVLNGWPGLKDLEVKKIEYKTHIPKWRVHWHSGDNPNDSPPTYPHAVMGLQEVRAVLRAPGWTAQGWSQDSPGYVYWYTGPDIRDVPRLVFGTNIIKDFEKERYENSKNGMLSLLNPQSVEPSPKCVRVHMISHRYSLLEENLKDRVTYHSFALLEWDHGKHCTVIELAYFNGLGGYNARCNHVEVNPRHFEFISMCAFIAGLYEHYSVSTTYA